MSRETYDLDQVDGDGLTGQNRGSTHAIWTQRRQAKRRSRARVRRGGSNTAAKNGMHMRRNKRLSW